MMPSICGSVFNISVIGTSRNLLCTFIQCSCDVMWCLISAFLALHATIETIFDRESENYSLVTLVVIFALETTRWRTCSFIKCWEVLLSRDQILCSFQFEAQLYSKLSFVSFVSISTQEKAQKRETSFLSLTAEPASVLWSITNWEFNHVGKVLKQQRYNFAALEL